MTSLNALLNVQTQSLPLPGFCVKKSASMRRGFGHLNTLEELTLEDHP